jgi:F-type H+-transporting ATPase subunit delta
MSRETIARRYSAALADVVLTSGETETIKAELAAWTELFYNSTDLQTVFSNPAITHINKEKVLEDLIAKAKPARATANFLRILLKNGRLTEIGEINERFDTVLQERGGVVSAEIMSARELPENERTEFQTNLERLTGKKVNINYAVNKEIIGGVVTRIGSTVYDGSVKTKLENLREQLVNG